MASVTSEDENSDDNISDFSQKSNFSVAWDESSSEKPVSDTAHLLHLNKCPNLAINLSNRELYGRFAKHPKAKTEKVFKNIHRKCRYPLSTLIKDSEAFNHIFMGFTLCGQYFLSYTEKPYENVSLNLNSNTTPFTDGTYEYELYIWRFVPGRKLEYISKHKIFKHLKGDYVLDKIMFMQYPNDLYKIVCYGYDESHNPDLLHISIMTLPSPSSCIHCHGSFSSNEEFMHQGWCTKHGFMIHYMFLMTQPSPSFDPSISLGYPNHLVVNTGHHIHILNVFTLDPLQPNTSLSSLMKEDDTKCIPPTTNNFFSDTFSEVSESPSDYFSCSSVVDAILEDFMDPTIKAPKWIKKVVRRYSNGDFENSSLLSGQSRDDYNIPIEIPLLVQSLTDQQFDIVPDSKIDQIAERQIIVTQRSMDCDQFIQKRAQILCTETNLEFMHCEDYDIKVVYICPLNGVILSQAVIKIGALKSTEPNSKVENYWAHFLFTWNITTDAFDIIDSDSKKLFSAKEQLAIPTVKIPKFKCNNVWVLAYDTSHASKNYLRDFDNCFEICLRYSSFMLSADYDSDNSFESGDTE